MIDQPALYHSFVRELPGLGEAGAERPGAALERFARMLVALVDAAAGHSRSGPATVDMDTAMIIVGGLRELLVVSVQSGRDMHELRTSVGQTTRAIMSGMLL